MLLARVRGMREGNIFSLSVYRGRRGIPVSGSRPLPCLWSHVLSGGGKGLPVSGLRPFPGEGYPSQVLGQVTPSLTLPLPASNIAVVPPPSPCPSHPSRPEPGQGHPQPQPTPLSPFLALHATDRIWRRQDFVKSTLSSRGPSMSSWPFIAKLVQLQTRIGHLLLWSNLVF